MREKLLELHLPTSEKKGYKHSKCQNALVRTKRLRWISVSAVRLKQKAVAM